MKRIIAATLLLATTTTANPAVSATTTVGATTTVPVDLNGLARCPGQVALNGVESTKFPLGRPLPQSGSSVVLQFGTADFLITICRESNGAYWYFSRNRANAKIGVFAPATPGQGGLTAPYPLNGPEVEYVTSGAGVAYAKGTKLLPRTETICSSAKNLPAGFEARAPRIARLLSEALARPEHLGGLRQVLCTLGLLHRGARTRHHQFVKGKPRRRRHVDEDPWARHQRCRLRTWFTTMRNIQVLRDDCPRKVASVRNTRRKTSCETSRASSQSWSRWKARA